MPRRVWRKTQANVFPARLSLFIGAPPNVTAVSPMSIRRRFLSKKYHRGE
jgi:hypothetical protein